MLWGHFDNVMLLSPVYACQKTAASDLAVDRFIEPSSYRNGFSLDVITEHGSERTPAHPEYCLDAVSFLPFPDSVHATPNQCQKKTDLMQSM